LVSISAHLLRSARQGVTPYLLTQPHWLLTQEFIVETPD